MTRRLEQATEDALLSSPRSAMRSIQEGAFSPELKEELMSKLAAADLTPTDRSAGPWAGEETTEQAVRRMLEDAHKPLKPGPRERPVVVVDMRPRWEPRRTPGEKAGDAREKAAAYAGLGLGKKGEDEKEEEDKGLNQSERDAMRREFRERFTPGARAVPVSISALASLANERIEDAIARGQFKHIPRGKAAERDTRADNPFVDTTEYIMNKMIKRQEIVPPWIEKQQELARTAAAFRTQLRADWTRRAMQLVVARVGNQIEQQVRRAQAHAEAELALNPRTKDVDKISVPSNVTDDVIMARTTSTSPSSSISLNNSNTQDLEIVPPLRDPSWETSQRQFLTISTDRLNATARSYNLMAPELAKKPYFSLERELGACYADVAASLADQIRARAARNLAANADQAGGLLGRLMGGSSGGGSESWRGMDAGTVKSVEGREKRYGFREMWRDLWAG